MARVLKKKKKRVDNQLPATEGTFSVNTVNVFINHPDKKEGKVQSEL